MPTVTTWPPPGADGVLLVIAHPDDEAMFFAPAVTAVTEKAVAGASASPRRRPHPTPQLRILCLSTGDADGLGRTRARELVRAARSLGVPQDRVAVLDDPRLRDGMRERWARGDVARAVAAELRRAAEGAEGAAKASPRRRGGGSGRGGGWAVLTFDAHGVSGHPNHRDTSAGVAEAASAAAQSGGSGDSTIHSVWQLRSEPLALKFLGPVGALLAVLLAMLGWRRSGGGAAAAVPSPLAVVPARPLPVLASLRAMRQHASQWVWFRWLFVAFSSYGWVNVLERVDVGRRR